MIDMIEIAERWNKVRDNVSQTAQRCGRNIDDIRIIAVSKTHPFEMLRLAAEAGVPLFGENYAQEFVEKYKAFEEAGVIQPEWHYIGHLQTNKAKFVVPIASAIHSVDSIRLAEEISKQADKLNKTMNILLQVNTSGEDSKFGCEPDYLAELAEDVLPLPNLNIIGLMTIGSFSEDETVIRKEFRLLRSLLEKVRLKFPDSGIKELSMGMSGDYEIAIEEGATYLRIGTAIFGERDYSRR